MDIDFTLPEIPYGNGELAEWSVVQPIEMKKANTVSVLDAWLSLRPEDFLPARVLGSDCELWSSAGP